jgi:hypothetical protein
MQVGAEMRCAIAARSMKHMRPRRAYESNSEIAQVIIAARGSRELELELIQTQMTQKPMLRAEVYARALRASQNRKEDSV